MSIILQIRNAYRRLMGKHRLIRYEEGDTTYV